MDGMNKEKWQAMSRKDKYEHIMYYYKKYIIIALVSLFIIGQLVYFCITHVDPTVSVLMINSYVSDQLDQSVFDEFCAKYGYDNSEGKMAIYNNFYIWTEEEGADDDMINFSYENMSVLQTWMQAGQDDVIIGRGVFVENGLLHGEAFLDLREVFTPEQLAKYADYIVYGNPADVDEEYEDVVEELTEPYPCAILLKDNAWINATGTYKECYAAIAINAGNKEGAADFLEYLLSKQP